MFPLSVEWSSPLMETVFGLLYLSLALLVTVDVLLKKSDVRSALGGAAASRAWLVRVSAQATILGRAASMSRWST